MLSEKSPYPDGVPDPQGSSPDVSAPEDVVSADPSLVPEEALPDSPVEESEVLEEAATVGEGEGGEPVSEETPEEPVLMETIPAEEQSPGQLLEACPACGTLMDVTQQAPFARIFCPSCGQNLRARRQFNNYQLIELLGEGGMGSVFKALDCNLRRNVALKILKRECSANAAERAKLEQEARITASINHPHVVKVFSFGEDHGQFYLAMELVEKGSLDQLMGIQRRVAEMQVLTVGIQIAEGLEAGLERGLIHRDIKPGNILFSDPHTAKLVDFGLAIVMDEAAQERGEIWGTPYYIAPEKLDNQPEDFRSDMYSLGGTLFHALAGRPPYEAETASMVALKQLKSMPISLQAFAPDVSSETAYVINRMLAKDPASRYASYRELIEHLSYARHKLIERTQKPVQPKARVVIETQASRNLSAYLSLGILTCVIAIGVGLFVFRDKIFPSAEEDSSSAPAFNVEQAQRDFDSAVRLLADRQFDEARSSFRNIANRPGATQPIRNWALFNQGLTALAAGSPEDAAHVFAAVRKQDGPYTTDPPQSFVASFFVEVSKILAEPEKPISAEIRNIYSANNFEAFGLLAFALHDWEIGRFKDAGNLLKAFIPGKVAPPDQWIEQYKPLAGLYLSDYQLLEPLEEGLPKVSSPAQADALMSRLRQARPNLSTGNRVSERFDAIEQQLIAKGARP